MTFINSLSLYIHIPWCIKKCPYCDFNSHANSAQQISNNEAAYVQRLIDDLHQHQDILATRQINTIFIGGGTPSLFSAGAYTDLFNAIDTIGNIANNVEITLEANPSSVEQQRFRDYRTAGINRLSIGVQSFSDDALRALGRIHNSDAADHAICCAQHVGFDRINLDIMYGLPQQTINAGLVDLQKALTYNTEHVSWYQLTLEPNTVFYRYPPKLTNEDDIIAMENDGYTLLDNAGFKRYEISAYCQSDAQCQHNVNYWQYGDYLGIGAGAHSKVTYDDGKTITRFRKAKQPNHYLNPEKPMIVQQDIIPESERPFEFMLNALRLFTPTSFNHFTQRTALEKSTILPILDKAKQRNWLRYDDKQFYPTPLGHRYLNDLTALFLPKSFSDK